VRNGQAGVYDGGGEVTAETKKERPILFSREIETTAADKLAKVEAELIKNQIRIAKAINYAFVCLNVASCEKIKNQFRNIESILFGIDIEDLANLPATGDKDES
jgi:hypothetical protein